MCKFFKTFFQFLFQCPYRLHAVLVHEGQAVSGHYWAYVFSTKYQKWLKFNDIAVTEASWEEIQKDSVGGFHNTSAYCVMYVDQNFPDLLSGQSVLFCLAYLIFIRLLYVVQAQLFLYKLFF